MFSYNVACEFTDATVAERWIAWLADQHLHEVCQAGAVDAEVIRFDETRGLSDVEGGPVVRCEVRYHFASREDFERYEREHAPRLRDEGLNRFPPELGLSYSRSTGEVVASYPSLPDAQMNGGQ